MNNLRQQARLNPKNILNFAVVIILVMNFTFTYTYAAGLLGIPFLLFGLGMLGIFGLYMLINVDKLHELLRTPVIRWFLILFVAIPILSAVYAPFFSPRFIGYEVMKGALFLATLIYIRNAGAHSFARWVFVAWIISAAGIVVSYFYPGFFATSAALQEEARAGGAVYTGQLSIGSAHLGRAFGFYLQPNRASYALLLQTVIVTMFLFSNRTLLRYSILGITFGTILLTGSRGGLAVFFVVLSVILLQELVLGVRSKEGYRKSFFTGLSSYFVFFVIAVTAFLVLQNVGIFGQSGQTAVGRIVETIIGDDVFFDSSVQARLHAQQAYLSGIASSPLIGHGLASTVFDQARGGLLRSSHNGFLEPAYQFGVPVAVAMYGWLIFLATRRQSKQLRRVLLFDLSWSFVALIFTASMVTGGVFEWRIASSLLGFWVGAVYWGGFMVKQPEFPAAAPYRRGRRLGYRHG